MKVFVLGLDGATFDCLLPLMSEGVIPNLKDIHENWASGSLKTIFPPVTGPAWLALASGMNPGKTGVFDYINRTTEDNDRMAPVSSAHYKGRAVWDYLNQIGLKTGIFNYPTLVPPPSVDGFAVSGIGRNDESRYCFPESLESELDQLTGGYETTLNLRNRRYKRNISDFFDDLERIMGKQEAALFYLVREKQWDFFWAVFSFTDWMQHVIWSYIDKSHPFHDGQQADLVARRYREVWRSIDETIGNLLKALPEETAFIIISDHGAGPIDSVFYPNVWLEEKGWLKKRNLGWKDVAIRKMKLFSSGNDNKYARRIESVVREKILRIRNSIDLIDLKDSLAYSPEHNTMFGCISFTSKGRTEPNFKDVLIRELRRLPETVEGVRSIDIYLPEDIYWGEHVRLSPEILFVINDYRATVEVDLTETSFVPRPSIDIRTGGHRSEGIFLARGEGIKKARLRDISVMDVAPTILALCGLNPPPNIDGRVIVQCIDSAISELGSVDIFQDQVHHGRAIEGEGDLDEMKKMLKSLGYM